MMLHFLLIFCFSSDLDKTICICHNCREYSKCKNLPKLDHTLPGFKSDYQTVVAESKNIRIELIDMDPITLDLGIFMNQNVTLNYFYLANFNLTLLYDSMVDYTTIDLSFDPSVNKILNVYFASRSESITNDEIKLNIGSIIIPDGKKIINAYFVRDVSHFTLSYSSILLQINSFTNLTSLIQTTAGNTTIRIDWKDKASFSLSKSGTTIKYLEQEPKSFVYIPGNPLEIYMKLEKSFSDELIRITHTEDMGFADFPILHFTKIGHIILEGKYWKPTSQDQIFYIDRSGIVEFPIGDLPFGFNTYESLTIVFKGDSIIYGDLIGNGITRNSFNYTGNTPITVKCGNVNSYLNLYSPFLNVEIEKYNILIASNQYFPIIFCVSSEGISHVTIKDLYEPYSRFDLDYYVYSMFTEAISDEEIEALGFYRGVEICCLPVGKFTYKKIKNVELATKSPATNLIIPGFSKNSNFMTVNNTKEEKVARFIFSLYESPYLTPISYCFSNNDGCPKPIGYEGYTLKIMMNLTKALNLWEIVPGTYKNILFGISTIKDPDNFLLDFDSLPESSRDINLTIFGNPKYDVELHYKDTLSRIKHLTVIGCRLVDSVALNQDSVLLWNVSLKEGNTYSIGANTNFSADIITYNNLMAYQSDFYISKFQIIDRSSKYDENPHNKIVIKRNQWEFCAIMNGNDKCRIIDYDNVGTMSFEANYTLDIYLEAKSKDRIKPFSIFTKNDISITLRNINWDQVTYTDDIIVNHNTHKLEMILTYPFQIDHFDFIGIGSRITTVDYEDRESICLYDLTAQSSCKSSFEHFSSYEITDSIMDNLSVITNSQIDIFIDPHPDVITIDFSLFESKTISLETYKSEVPDKIKLEYSVTEINPHYSKTIWKNIEIDIDPIDVELTFGYLLIDNVKLSNNFLSHVTLNVSRLECKYDDLIKFKKININDQLILTGKVPTQGKPISIKFNNDEDADDLVAEMKGDVHLKLLKSGFVLNNLITFEMQQSPNYDVLLKFDEAKIIVDCDEAVEKEDVPLMTFECLKTSQIYFTGKFPLIESTENPLIRIKSSADDLHITIEEYAPISIPDSKMAHYHLKSADCRITGPVSYSYYENLKLETQIIIDTSIPEDQKVNFFVENGLNYYTSNPDEFNTVISTKVASPNVHVIYQKATQNSNSNIPLKFELAVGKDDTSSVEFIDALDRFSINVFFNIECKMYEHITGKESDYPLFNRENMIFRARNIDLDLVTIRKVYIETNGKAIHGFNSAADSLGIKIVESMQANFKEVRLYRTKYPFDIPFTISVMEPNQEDATSEVVVNPTKEDWIDAVIDFIPLNVTEIQLKVKTEINQFPLDFSKFIEKRNSMPINVFDAEFNTKKIVTFYPPNSNQLNIILNNIKVDIKEKAKANSKNIVVKRINFTDCEFSTKDISFGEGIETLVLDVDTLNLLIKDKMLETFHNSMIIHSANIIIFNEDGWQFKEDYDKESEIILPSKFPKISFETTKKFKLNIENENIRKIHGIELNAFPLEDKSIIMSFSRNWANIKNIEGNFIIKTNNAKKVKASASSFPVPKIFDCQDEDVVYQIKADDQGNFDPIKFEDMKLIDEYYLLDLNMIPPEFRAYIGTSITVSGDSGFMLVDDIGQVEIENYEIMKDSSAIFSNIVVSGNMTLNPNSKSAGNFNLTEDVRIVLNWNLTHSPYIYFGENIENLPKLEFCFDNETADSDYFNEHYYNDWGVVIAEGDFDCHTLARQETVFSSPYKYFNDGKDLVLSLTCDYSNNGRVLILYGRKEISDDGGDSGGDDSGSGDGGDMKINTTGTILIAVAAVFAVAFLVCLVIYCRTKRKIEEMKLLLPLADQGQHDIQGSVNTAQSLAAISATADDNF